MSNETDSRQEAILAIIDQLEVPEEQSGDIELLKALVRGESIEAYALNVYSSAEPPPKGTSILLSALPTKLEPE